MKLIIDIPDKTFECLENMLKAECVDPYSLADIIVNKSIPIIPTEEQPTGEWVYVQYDAPQIGNWHCSNCRHIEWGSVSQKPYYDYCPNCGAKMNNIPVDLNEVKAIAEEAEDEQSCSE